MTEALGLKIMLELALSSLWVSPTSTTSISSHRDVKLCLCGNHFFLGHKDSSTGGQILVLQTLIPTKLIGDDVIGNLHTLQRLFKNPSFLFAKANSTTSSS